MRKNRGTVTASVNEEARKAIFGTLEAEWRTASLLAMKVLHTHAPAISALTPVFKDAKSLTMATDKFFRVYINLNFVAELINDARQVSPSKPCEMCGAKQHHHLAYVAGAICHEAMHPLNYHFKRSDDIFAECKDVWNLAGDCEINDDLIEIFKDPSSTNGGTVPNICMRPNWIYPQTYNFATGRIAEYYYFELMQNPPPKPPPCNCGSGAHGSGEDWDEAEPGEGSVYPGVPQAEIPFMQKQIADNIEQAAKAGKMPAGMLEWAKGVLAKPKYDWRKDLAKSFRTSINQAYGFDLPTFRRFARDCAASNYNVIQPSHYKPVPVVGVVLDTSGSMGGFTPGSPLYEAVCEAEGITKAVGANIQILDVDCAANASDIQNVSTVKGMKLRGHGGTDMRVGIEVFRARKPKPDVVLVLTDGETPWPEYKPKEFRVIIGLVGKPSEHTIKACPPWAKVVLITDDGKQSKRKK